MMACMMTFFTPENPYQGHGSEAKLVAPTEDCRQRSLVMGGPNITSLPGQVPHPTPALRPRAAPNTRNST